MTDATPVTRGLHRGHAAKSPESRERSLAGLKRGHVQHGAYTGARLQELRSRHDAELAETFPHLHRTRRALLAECLAKCELVMAWEDEHGILQKGSAKLGQTFPVVGALERWSARADRLLEEAVAGETGATRADGHGTLAELTAELGAAEDAAEPDDAEVIA